MTPAKRWALIAGITAGAVIATMGASMADTWYSYNMQVPTLGGDVFSSQTDTMEHAPTAYVQESYASGGGAIWYAVAYEDDSQLTPFTKVPTDNDDVYAMSGNPEYLQNGFPVKLEAQSGADYLESTNVQGTWDP